MLPLQLRRQLVRRWSASAAALFCSASWASFWRMASAEAATAATQSEHTPSAGSGPRPGRSQSTHTHFSRPGAGRCEGTRSPPPPAT
ncbi:hypothetical protein [Streptomyces sp. NPDC126503]|uniref:hypothetical protein n=1 Tax=Streptomyces sp. NPDC126503 TaxID=3155315 RepID=UPI00331E216C